MRAVVDTNVLVVANERSPQAGPGCVLACVHHLQRLRQEGRIVIDDGWRILREYGSHASDTGQPGVGDEFYLWVLQHRGTSRVEEVPITEVGGRRGFAEFPDDPALDTFDPNDRKFAATAVVAEAPVWNAVDSDWWHYRHVLEAHGIVVEFLCPGHFDGTIAESVRS